MRQASKTNTTALQGGVRKQYVPLLLRALMIGLAAALFTFVVLNRTGAWFLSLDTTQNTINIGNAQISVSSIDNPFLFTGQVRTDIPVNVVNLSNTHVVVRAYLNVHWEEGYDLGDVVAVLANANWTSSEEGYFYYNEVLKPSGQSPDSVNFLSAIEIFDQTGAKLGKYFIVNVYFEAVQYAHGAYANLWLSAPTDWLVLIG